MAGHGGLAGAGAGLGATGLARTSLAPVAAGTAPPSIQDTLGAPAALSLLIPVSLPSVSTPSIGVGATSAAGVGTGGCPGAGAGAPAVPGTPAVGTELSARESAFNAVRTAYEARVHRVVAGAGAAGTAVRAGGAGPASGGTEIGKGADEFSLRPIAASAPGVAGPSQPVPIDPTLVPLPATCDLDIADTSQSRLHSQAQ
ncbi:hypothetical protein GGX14DRAFT_569388 [Mycena pura]|uniref:Uncharacterized protein n=1 Tax=Mycena pura TaxID=153505 RepID=A0AAD6V831_9AGAR|nr:hypothetical protein GGX14DRAFT_569388 [Mycena pura]